MSNDKKVFLDDSTLASIEARANAASLGPWNLSFHNGAGNLFRLNNPQTANEFVRESPHNLTFIAHARTDIPALIADLRAAREALQFYGSKSNYELKMRHASNPIIHHEWESSDVQDDEGKLARKALGEE